ncbi:MAG: GAF domain-containing protein [Schleiferiaceae bacterium]|nr:GAF domain-containing protein [Schleiferiaceae bacterium]
MRYKRSIHKNKPKHKKICDSLRLQKSYFDWVGFYWMNDVDQTLELGAFSGLNTEHNRIPYGKGICGQVAISGKIIEVPNIHEASNYIACSLKTNSELVVPIYKNEKLIGQLDIDSHSVNPFKLSDKALLEKICESVADDILP